jgi:hypothetical protein
MSGAGGWVRAFLLTLLVEEVVVLAMTRGDAEPRGRRAALVLFANLATHPSVWFFFPLALRDDSSRLIASEAWAVLLEAAFYWLTMKMTESRALAVSAIANGASLGIGLLVRAAGLV